MVRFPNVLKFPLVSETLVLIIEVSRADFPLVTGRTPCIRLGVDLLLLQRSRRIRHGILP